jgi:hypothetical protein
MNSWTNIAKHTLIERTRRLGSNKPTDSNASQMRGS